MAIDSRSIRNVHAPDQEATNLATTSERIDRLALAKSIDPQGRFKVLTHHPLFPLIHGRLVAGQSPEAIAYWLQGRLAPDDPLGVSSLSANALGHRLRRFRDRLPIAVFLPQSFIDALINDAGADVDAIARLRGLLMVQEDRLERAYRIEAGMNLPLEQTRREVETARDIIMSIVKAQIDLGVAEGRLTPAAMSLTQVNVSPGGSVAMPPLGPPIHEFAHRHPEHAAMLIDALRSIPIEGEWREAPEPK